MQAANKLGRNAQIASQLKQNNITQKPKNKTIQNNLFMAPVFALNNSNSLQLHIFHKLQSH